MSENPDENGLWKSIRILLAWIWYFILVAFTWPYDLFNINPTPPNSEKDANSLWE